MLRPFVCGVGACVILALSGCTREDTFRGVISDSVCGGRHPEDEHAAPLSAKECTLRCVRDGATFVLVGSDDRIYNIADQDDARLREHAGEWVVIRGAAKNGTIRLATVSTDSPGN